MAFTPPCARPTIRARGLLVIIGVTADGIKEWAVISAGVCDSTASWLEDLHDLRPGGRTRLAVGTAP